MRRLSAPCGGGGTASSSLPPPTRLVPAAHLPHLFAGPAPRPLQVDERARSLAGAGWALADLLEPVAELLADVGDGFPGGAERAPHALGVVLARGARLLARRRFLAATDVLAVDDAVVLALADPLQQLVGATDRHRVGEVEVEQQPRQPLEAAAALGVLEALRHERIEVELVGGLAGGKGHQHAADRERVARHHSGPTVARELGRPEPL